jgi:hypothetical protein
MAGGSNSGIFATIKNTRIINWIVMKKHALMIKSFIGFFWLTGTIFAQQQEPQPVEFRPISENLYEVLGGRGAQGGAYIGDDGVLLIDAKMDETSVEQTI